MKRDRVPKTVKDWLQMGAGLVILAVIGYLLFKAVELFFTYLQSVDAAVGAAIIAAATTVIVGIVSQ